MLRLLAIATLSASLAGCVTAGSPARWTDSPLAAGHVNMPPSAPRNTNACIHDEGYGRWTDCGAEM